MSTTRNWLGGKHDFFAANAWTPAGRPVPGDTAVIGGGTGSSPNVAAVQNAALDGINVVLDSGPQAATPGVVPTLALSNAIIASSTSIEVPPLNSYYGGTYAIPVSGFAVNQGLINENGYSNTLNITLANNTLLLNDRTGKISGFGSTLNIEGGARAALVNDGTISVRAETVDVGVPVFGHGEFNLSRDGTPFSGHQGLGSTLEFHQGVGDGQTIALASSELVLDTPLTFAATIDAQGVQHRAGPILTSDPPLNSSVLLKGEHATDLTFQNNILTVFDGQTTLAHLNFAAGLNSDDFVLSNYPQGALVDISLPPLGAASGQTAQTDVVGALLQAHA